MITQRTKAFIGIVAFQVFLSAMFLMLGSLFATIIITDDLVDAINQFQCMPVQLP